MSSRPLHVRGRAAIGEGLSSYVIAEIGTNHNRSVSTAKLMLQALADTGCDCAKFQVYEPDEIVSARVRAADYGFDRLYGDISAQEMFERHLKTPKAWFPELRDLCHALGMDFSATIHGADGLRWAQQVGLDIVKVASMDHTNLPFLQSLKNSVEAPLLLSAGMAELSDIDAAMAAVDGHRAGVGLFHCCSIYPAAREEVRLENIPFLRDRYASPVGFSDHTIGVEAALDARRVGAVVFEKHVTLDRTQPGPDHSFAMEMNEFATYVKALKAAVTHPAEARTEFLMPPPAEWRNRALALKSIIVRRPLPAGHLLSAGDVYMARPGSGISPARWPQVVGRTLARSVEGEVPLQWDDLDVSARG
jgi:N,N'-diacetyllegionaminate synthase